MKICLPARGRYLLCSLLMLIALARNAGASIPISIPPGGAFSGTTTGQGTLPNVGFAVLENSSPNGVDGMAIFEFRPSNVVVSETSVPASAPLQAGLLFAEVSGAVNTGIAFANPGTMPAEISWMTSAGRSGSFTLAPGSQMARFLTESPFELSEFAGTFEFHSSVAVPVIALRSLTNERAEFLVTALSVVEPGRTSSDEQFIPQIVLGAGWATRIDLVNASDQIASGVLSLRLPSGQSLRQIEYRIESHSSLKIEPPVVQGLTVAYARITPSAGSKAPFGAAMLSFRSGGVTTTLVAMPTTPAVSGVRIYAELKGEPSRPGRIATGIAIANPTTSAAEINLELLTLGGTPTGLTAKRTIPALAQQAFYLDAVSEFYLRIPPNFKGILNVSSSTGIAITALRNRINERGDYLVTPVPAVNTNSIDPTSSFFPHIVDGGGFRTQIILINHNANGVEGALSLLGTMGQPLAVDIVPEPVLPKYSGSVTDPAGDAAPLAPGVPGYDLISATAVTQNGYVTFSVRFAPGTFQQQITQTEIDIDADQDPSTGFPKYDQGQPLDPSFPADFYIEVGGNGAGVLTHAGVPNSRVGIVYLPVQTRPDGFDLTIALEFLLKDDGQFDFKVRSRGFGTTGLLTLPVDFMPAMGAAPATVR